MRAEHITDYERETFCKDCGEICSNHCVIWRKAGERMEQAEKKKWTDYLPTEVHTRLCDCRSIKGDLTTLVNARWEFLQAKGKDKAGFTKEDALVYVLELLDANSQPDLTDLTREEYDALCGRW